MHERHAAMRVSRCPNARGEKARGGREEQRFSVWCRCLRGFLYPWQLGFIDRLCCIGDFCWSFLGLLSAAVSETNAFWLYVGSMMDKGKKAKLDDEEGSELDTELVMAIEKLQEVQDELERVSLFSLIFSPSSFIMDTKGNC